MRLTLVLGGGTALLLSAASAFADAPPTPPLEASPEWTPADNEQRRPHHLRSIVEMGTGLVVGTGGYWLFKNKNLVDWDNPSSLARFDGSAWVMDNNSIIVNFLYHPLTGALTYNWARGNHQSVAGAFGYSFLTSFVWEFAIEFKEKVSVNDVLVTPGAGLPIGEFFYKLGLYLDTGHHDSIAFDAARALLGSGVALDRALDGRPAPRVRSRDSLGFSSKIWHDFEVRFGVGEVSTRSLGDYARYQIGAAGKLSTLPGYGAPGRWGHGFYGAELSSFALNVENSRYGSGVAVAADTTLLGYHFQDFARRGTDLDGASFTVGTGLSFDFLRSSANRYESVENAVSLPEPKLAYHAPNRREQYSALQLPGISTDFRVLRPWAGLAGSARLQPSFAGLGAPAFYEWSAENLEERSKHILHRQGYFYGWGAALNASLRGRLGPLRADLDVSYAAYASQDGLDRHADELTVDVHATGSLLSYRLALGLAPRPDCVFALQLGARRFQSTVGGFDLVARSTERGVSARFNF